MMPLMKKEEVIKLAEMARLSLTDEEIAKFQAEFSSILDYVGAVEEVSGDYIQLTKKAGAVSNVFREDALTVEPGSFSDEAIASFPERSGRYLSVKKILKNDDA